MKRVLNLYLAFFALVLLSGCIEFNLKVELNPDGSGTITEEVLFSRKFMNMMESFAQMNGEKKDKDDFDLLNMNDLKKKAIDYGEDVELVKAEKLERKTMSGYSAVYKFNDINKLKVDDDPTSKMPDDLPGQDKDPGKNPFTFTFTKGNPSSLIIHMNKDVDEMMGDFGNDEEAGDENDMMLEQMKEMLREMKTSIILEIDGDIVKTNATYLKDNKITLIDIDFGKILDQPGKFDELKKLKPKSFKEAKDFFSDVPGIKIEFNEDLEVKFK